MKKIILTLLLVLAAASLAYADVIVLKDGQTIHGEILAYDAAGVTIQVNGVEYYVAAYAIDGITLQEAYAPPLPSVAPSEVRSGWAAVGPYAYSGLAGIGQLHRQIVVTGSVVNLRSGPGTSHAVIGKVGRGDVLTAVARVADWYRIAYPNGATAWISAALVKDLAVEQRVAMGSVGYGPTYDLGAAQAMRREAYPYNAWGTYGMTGDNAAQWQQYYWDYQLRTSVPGIAPAGYSPAIQR